MFQGNDGPPGTGVSVELALSRKARLSNLRYALSLEIPASPEAEIPGRISLRFDDADSTRPLWIDFQQPASQVFSVSVGSTQIDPEIRDGHISIPARLLRPEENAVSIQFLAGQAPLNRREDYLYSLFVPDHAALAFPCFDQPDLKANFQLNLDVPKGWAGVSNAPILRRSQSGGRQQIQFAETKPLSTYLFSFAAGQFKSLKSERAGHEMAMFYREPDEVKVARNAEKIFELHAAALDWLESYTGIPYPFDKFDFVLIPDFQFGGMEHPGAILYRESSLFLDESATLDQELNRARLIAHETSHMWFGDLVTMKWFDDVWMKEVFANFMAAKIVNPAFPGVNHELQFLLSHYPAAFSVDRTAGTHPIRQVLENLKDASSLYGPIIYQKAPIVMRQLEITLGAGVFREGVREYLDAYAFDNATWSDLVGILDRKSPTDVGEWSRHWIEEAGRPSLAVDVLRDSSGNFSGVRLTQSDPAGLGRIWSQILRLHLGISGSTISDIVKLDRRSVEYVPQSGSVSGHMPRWVLADGIGYGYVEMDPGTMDHLLKNLSELPDELTRAAAWIQLWEQMLEGLIPPDSLLLLALEVLPSESSEPTTEMILGCLDQLFWRFLSLERRTARHDEVEETLWELLNGEASSSRKTAYFRTYTSLATSREAIRKLEGIWNKELRIEGLILAEEEQIRLTQELAVREVSDWEGILAAQQARIGSSERRQRFEFVQPALSADISVRDRFFQSLVDPERRRRERWVLEALHYLHHPLREQQSRKYIRPALNMLEEIKATGDIFFPTGWLDSTLDGHSSPEAAAIVQTFLSESNLPPRLRDKVLQVADGLFRAGKIQRIHSAK